MNTTNNDAANNGQASRNFVVVPIPPGMTEEMLQMRRERNRKYWEQYSEDRTRADEDRELYWDNKELADETARNTLNNTTISDQADDDQASSNWIVVPPPPGMTEEMRQERNRQYWEARDQRSHSKKKSGNKTRNIRCKSTSFSASPASLNHTQNVLE
jgi:hypothetical protein